MPRPKSSAGTIPSAVLGSLLLAANATWVMNTWAVYPLPPSVEASSHAVQKAYLERRGRDVLQEKLRAGRKRHDSRQAARRALICDIRSAAEARQARIRAALSLPPHAWRGGIPLRTMQQFGFGAIVTCVLIYSTRRLVAGVSTEDGLDRWNDIGLSARNTLSPPGTVDLKALRVTTGQDPAMLRQVVDVYLHETCERLQRLRLAVDASAGPEIKRLAQDGAGSSTLCGMDEIATLFRRLVDLGGQSRIQEAHLVLRNTEHAFARIRQSLAAQSIVPADDAELAEPTDPCHAPDPTQRSALDLSRSGGSIIAALDTPPSVETEPSP